MIDEDFQFKRKLFSENFEELKRELIVKLDFKKEGIEMIVSEVFNK